MNTKEILQERKLELERKRSLPLQDKVDLSCERIESWWKHWDGQVFNMSDDELQKNMNRLLGRVRGIGDEDSVTIVPEDADAFSNEQTSDE